eukprot:6179529-Pleurochrysis_carterae.AAC.2
MIPSATRCAREIRSATSGLMLNDVAVCSTTKPEGAFAGRPGSFSSVCTSTSASASLSSGLVVLCLCACRVAKGRDVRTRGFGAAQRATPTSTFDGSQPCESQPKCGVTCCSQI